MGASEVLKVGFGFELPFREYPERSNTRSGSLKTHQCLLTCDIQPLIRFQCQWYLWWLNWWNCHQRYHWHWNLIKGWRSQVRRHWCVFKLPDRVLDLSGYSLNGSSNPKPTFNTSEAPINTTSTSSNYFQFLIIYQLCFMIRFSLLTIPTTTVLWLLPFA